ncbi:STAS domain-containing protein [Actinotalea sp. M2MS4P-6]|uniref:STAS domain-containing protein n=1 Tax=Actinotalea sp. M2MS4P-6 TaxID=2983762 RepID=UPI0021E42936|nr:STAS domain-containing protein [Actinotalea sp. M2MS4P-6]MCV2392736.1 STAS domain-containing protein [Actinotalea sp. M2MS4P-6]
MGDATLQDLEQDGLEAVAVGDGTLVRMWGSVDESLRSRAGVAMAYALARSGPVVMDAGRVEFLDSSGLAFILQMLQAGEEDGRAVVLRDPPDLLLDMLQVLGLAGEVPLEFSSR